MSRARRLVFIALVAAQALAPLAMAAAKEANLAFGATVRLRTVPVDPLDVFRGRYVRLRYEISQLPAQPGARAGDTVYVVLAHSDDAWSGSQATLTRPGEGATFIRGRVVSRLDGAAEAEIEYGIETAYVDERKAARYEQAAREGTVYVDVALDEEGGGMIEKVVLPELDGASR
jgi:uncharacterized membrane-anchored protein